MTHFGLNYNFIFPQAFRLMYDMCITENMNMMNSTTAIYPQRDAEKPFPQNVQLISGELWYSYLQRLSIALGYVHFRGFIEDYVNHLGDEYWRRYEVPLYDCNWKGLDLGFRIPGNELFLMTSVYPGLAPLLSRAAQTRYVNSFHTPRHGIDLLGASVRSLITGLYRCPRCWSECKEEYGSPIYFREHNMPGVTVCRKHGCALERFAGKRGYELTQDIFEPVDIKPNAKAYAQLCADLINNGIQCNLQDVIRAVKTALREKYGFKTVRECSALPKETWVNAYGKSLQDVAKTLLGGYLTEPEPQSTIAFILFLFGGVEELKKSISTDSPKAVFINELRAGKFEMISEYQDTYIRLRCNKCGYEFATTPHGIVTGLGCPDCLKSVTPKQLLTRQFSKVGNGFRCLSRVAGQTSYVRIERKSTGEVMRCRFLEFINNGTYEKEYIPLFRAYLGPSERANRRNTDESIQDEISKYGDYILEEHTIVGAKSIHMLGIRHQDCNGFFRTDLCSFRRAPFCRVCRKKMRYTTESYAAKINDISNGAFRLVSEYSGHNNQVTIEHIETGTLIDVKPRRIGDKIEKYVRNPEWQFFKNEGNAVQQKILDRIEKAEGILFFSDFKDIYESGTIRNCLLKLERTGQIKSLYKGVLCKKTLDLTSLQIVDSMWVLRKEKRVGFHFGDLLLNDIGFSIKHPRMCIGTSIIGRHEDTNMKTVCGETFYVRGCGVQVTEGNWTVLAAYYTIVLKDMLSNEISIDSVKKILARWLLSLGKKLDDFLPFEKLFGGKHAVASVEVLAFARNLNEWAIAVEES